MSHPVSAEKVESVAEQLIEFMDKSGICLAEGRAAMHRLLNSFEGTEEIEKLRRFKQYVHDRLDDAGIPANPEPVQNEAHGCRVEGRLNFVFKGREGL